MMGNLEQEKKVSENSVGSRNTDTEIWRRVPGDFYSPSIHVTEGGSIGINVGGYVIVASVYKWHEAGEKLLSVPNDRPGRLSEAIQNAIFPERAIFNLRNFGNIRKPKSSNIASIIYREIGGSFIQIVGIENFLSACDIAEKYGTSVLARYSGAKPFMYGGRTIEGPPGGVPVVRIFSDIGRHVFIIGETCRKAYFLQSIALMKQCGARLSQIIREARGEEVQKKKLAVKTVEI